jgi:hypothetical protein
VKEAAGRILFLKTRLKGFTDLPTASNVVTEIHNFFNRNPRYLNAVNVAFLEKYPGDFHEKVYFNPAGVASLDELKRDVETLSIESASSGDSR